MTVADYQKTLTAAKNNLTRAQNILGDPDSSLRHASIAYGRAYENVDKLSGAVNRGELSTEQNKSYEQIKKRLGYVQSRLAERVTGHFNGWVDTYRQRVSNATSKNYQGVKNFLNNLEGHIDRWQKDLPEIKSLIEGDLSITKKEIELLKERLETRKKL